MKKRVCVILAVLLAFTCGAFAGCTKKEKRNNETDPFRMSILPVEGLFSPFFSTAGTDSTVTGMTQLSMFTTDSEANIAFGDEWPCVVKDYSEIMRDSTGKVTTTGDEKGTTTYQFVIKKGIKFSDGTPLTIKDVLFNMYVYLDPVYTGSSTMYSVDIQGLTSYRSLGVTSSDKEQSPIDTTADARATLRITNLRNWLTKAAGTESPAMSKEQADQAEADAKELATLFRAEIETDWASAGESLESYSKEYDVTEQWQVYLFTEGVTSVKLAQGTNKPVKNDAGKYVIDYTAIADSEFAHDKDSMIQFVYDYYGAGNPIRGLSGKLAGLLSWASGSTLISNITAEERGKVIAEYKEQGKNPKTVTGITVIKGTDFQPSKDSKQQAVYSPDYDVLQVVINGIDPKAKWNFGFTVAPMHYYSNAEISKKGYTDKDDYHTFNAPGTEGYDANKPISFGFPLGDYTYFTDVIQGRNKVPMGAGVYQPTDINGNTDFESLFSGFYNAATIYYMRNDYFYTCLGDGTDTSNNAKIKFARYKVLDSANVMNALTTKQLDYTDGVSATATNQNALNGKKVSKFIGFKTAKTNGYGYIGINAEKIPDINLRRAIMSVMDASLVESYYPGNLSERIYRPLSTSSWVYNYGEEIEPGKYDVWQPEAMYSYSVKENDLTEYKKHMDRARDTIGVTKDTNGNWGYKENGVTKPLKYTFTIAGGTDDHPAYQTLAAAMDVLNNDGWQITLNTDSRALTKLSSGSFTVWSAAWSATVDPDMYQVYHMDSKATNVRAWGYPYILKQAGSEDYRILEELSKLIDDGRKVLDQEARAPIYQQALGKVMDLAIEFPLYQRCDLFAWNTETVDVNTINTEPTTWTSPLDKIWQVSFK
ncbi:MAG: hypothetical protein HFE47_07705 [Clostridia bacterium]|nr:hypothetical protein [Clostridia bacterium]